MARHQSLAQFELLVMLAIAQLGDEAYAVAIRRHIEDRSSRPAAIGAVYAAVGRLERKSLVRSRLSDPLPQRGGRARRYFTLTRVGERELEEATAMLLRMIDGVSSAESAR